MSPKIISEIRKEPYYNDLTSRGYEYLGYGYMHVIFEKSDVIYKIVRSKFKNFDRKYDYKFEKNVLDMMRVHGFPTPNVLKIYEKGDFLPDFLVLAEEKISGSVKNEKTLKIENIEQIIASQEKAHAIKFPFFGQLYDKNLQFETWNEYLLYLIKRAGKAASIFSIEFDENAIKDYFSNYYTYTKEPCFLILDPNEENYIFDDHVKLLGIIDIDHPISFDPLYECAVCLYAKKYIFDMMRIIKPNYFNNHLETIKKYAVIHSLADILFLYDKDKEYFHNEIQTCAKNVVKFHKFLKSFT